MRLILRGDKLSAKKYIGFAKARLNDMKNIMNALNLNYNKKYYKLPDADLVVESRYGLDTAWIVGKGIRINDEFSAELLEISVSVLTPFISLPLIRETRYKEYIGIGTESEASVHANFLVVSFSDWDNDKVPPGVGQTIFYLGQEVTIDGDDTWMYRARERRHQFLITSTPPFTINIQVWPGQSFGFSADAGLIKGFWEEDPLFFGVDPNPGNTQTWRTLFTINDTDLIDYNPAGHVITIRVEDDSYSFINVGSNPANVGWHLDNNVDTGVRITVT